MENRQERIEERLAALTAGQTVQDGRLDDVEEEYVRIGEIEQEIRDMERKVNELRAVMLPDSLGHGGVIRRLTNLEEEREDKRETVKEWLKFWGPVLVAIITSTTLIIKEWGPAIAERWNHNMEELESPHEGIKVKHKHKHVEVPAEDPQDGEN